MKKALFIGVAAAAFAAAPAIAQHARDMGPMTRAQLEAKIAEHFAKIDTDGNGAVTKAEADAARQAIMAKMREKMAERHAARFGEMDKDKNGSISRAEWDVAGAARMKGDEEARAQGSSTAHGMRHRHMMHGGHFGDRMFARADTNNDGQVTLAEAKAGPLAMFDKADTNKDGTVTPEEHKAAFDAMRAEWRAKRGR